VSGVCVCACVRVCVCVWAAEGRPTHIGRVVVGGVRLVGARAKEAVV
jgi:hypothetical protein